MGSTGVIRAGEGPRTVDFRDEAAVRDGMDMVDSMYYMSDAKFSSPLALRKTIREAAGGRFDILGFEGNAISGSIMYTDADSSDGIAYDVYWQKDYTISGPGSHIVITKFNVLEEGEW